MEPTYIQEASSDSPGGHPSRTDLSETSSPVSSPPIISAAPRDQLTHLTQQVQALIGVVRELQEQQPATAHRQAKFLAPPQTAAPVSQQSTHRKSSQKEHSHHQIPSERYHSESLKRSRSSTLRSGGYEHRKGKEPRSSHRHRPQYPTSSSSESADEDINDRMERHLEEQNWRLEELSQKLHNHSGMEYDSRPPLSCRIMEERIPHRFRLPQLDPYDGTTDPLDHLESYKSLMQVQGATDALLCIAFSATLRKAAHAWYSRLLPRSIDSFQQLKKAFLAQFDACRKIPRVADSLFSVQQKEGELLKDFIA